MSKLVRNDNIMIVSLTIVVRVKENTHLENSFHNKQCTRIPK